MYVLSLKGKFDAAHRLKDYDGDCSNLHGHTWKYKIAIKGAKPDAYGIIVDFRVLKNSVKSLDHNGTLNEILGVPNPTAEFLSWWLWKQVVHYMNENNKQFARIKVTIWESKDAKVTYG